MKNIKRIFLSFFVIITLLSVSGCGCKQANTKPYVVNLEVWGLFENDDPYRDIFDAFKKKNPNVGIITYKKMTTDSYRKDLLDALASGQGPDIFLIHNNWLPGFKDKIYPSPKDVMNQQRVSKEIVDVVSDDFVSDGDVYALPLSVDSLGLYYNKDLFNAVGITAPPKDWQEFVNDTNRLTKLDSQNQIVRAGAAMGTSVNINRSTDILTLLMLQNNTVMVDDAHKKALFDGYASESEKSFSPGENALQFYTSFAKKSGPNYSWDPKMHYSIDAFSENTLGMMFNYSWQMEVIDSKAPKLNYAVAPIPQFAGEKQVNVANYWGYAVAKNRTPDTKGMDVNLAKGVTNDMRAREAWKLLSYMTTTYDPSSDNPGATVSNTNTTGTVQGAFDPAKDYLAKTKKPPARRDLVETEKTDARYGAFAVGNLISKSWYEADPDSIEALFSQLITKVNNGEVQVMDGLHSAALAVTQMMSR